MKIIHKIDTFLAELFPTYKQSNNDLEVLKAAFIKNYRIVSIPNQLFKVNNKLNNYYLSWTIAISFALGKLDFEACFKVIQFL